MYGALTFIKIGPEDSDRAWLIASTASPQIAPVTDVNGDPVILSGGRPLYAGNGGGGIGGT